MDPLHPLSVLVWDCRHKWSHGVVPMGCEVLGETVCVLSQGKIGSCDSMHVSSTSDLSSWNSVLLPYQYMSLATYQSEFVAVGGRDPMTHEVTDEIWSSKDGMHWQPSLTPMPTKCYHTSCVGATYNLKEFLLVAGGQSSGGLYLDTVEVFQEGQWNAADPLPSACWNARSLIHEGNIYLMGGWNQRFYMYSCSCAMLQSCIKESIAETSPLWKKFKVPGERTTPSSYLSRLFSIDQKCVVRAYDRVTLSWVETTNIREKKESYTPFVATSVLPSGEWLVAHRYYGVNLIRLTSEFLFIAN